MIWRNRGSKRTAELEADCGAAGRALADALDADLPSDQFEEAYREARKLVLDRQYRRLRNIERTGDVLIASGVAVLLILIIVGAVLAL